MMDHFIQNERGGGFLTIKLTVLSSEDDLSKIPCWLCWKKFKIVSKKGGGGEFRGPIFTEYNND